MLHLLASFWTHSFEETLFYEAAVSLCSMETSEHCNLYEKYKMENSPVYFYLFFLMFFLF